MTDALYKRNRVKIWKDFLTHLGGTPRNHAGLYETIRACAVQAGASPSRGLSRTQVLKSLLDALGGTSRYADTQYQTIRKIMVITGVPLECCELPPQSKLGDATTRGWMMLGNPDEDWVFGDPDSGWAFGKSL